MHGQQLSGRFSLGSEAAKEGVIDCIIYGDGLVALTGQLHAPFTTLYLKRLAFQEHQIPKTDHI